MSPHMPSMPHAMRRLWLLPLCITPLLAACSPVEDAPSDLGASDRFALEVVEMGIGFDEPVVLEGAASTVTSATLTLNRLAVEDEARDGAYDGEIRAADEAGNATDLHLNVSVGAAGD